MRQENGENEILSKTAWYTPIPTFVSYIELLARIFFPNISYYSYTFWYGMNYLKEEMTQHKVENTQESLLGFKCLSPDIDKIIGKMQCEEEQSLPDIPYPEMR